MAETQVIRMPDGSPLLSMPLGRVHVAESLAIHTRLPLTADEQADIRRKVLARMPEGSTLEFVFLPMNGAPELAQAGAQQGVANA
jgi:hypothetical protein